MINRMASGTAGKAMGPSWTAAMSMGTGTVEALKDRHGGLCHYRGGQSAQQRASTTAAAGNGGACSKSKAVPAAGGATSRRKAQQEQDEELRTVMYLRNWGPTNN